MSADADVALTFTPELAQDVAELLEAAAEHVADREPVGPWEEILSARLTAMAREFRRGLKSYRDGLRLVDAIKGADQGHV
jgi:hypothetical protein